MMKQVMTRAWEIAKDGVTKFGGKVREYFAASLSIAWAEAKAPKTNKEVATLVVKHNIPEVVAEGFVKLAESMESTVERMRIRNWRGKRVYYDDKRRSQYQHKKGAFYYDLEQGRFVDPWYREEKDFGRMA